MIVIGIGSNSKAQVADIAAALAGVQAQIAAQGLERSQYLLVAALRRDEPWTPEVGRIEAVMDQACLKADRLSWYSQHELQARNAECLTRSEASIAAYEIASVCEAAALVGAGPGSRLVVPRMVFNNATGAAATMVQSIAEGLSALEKARSS